MEYDKDKVDEMVLALLFLTMFDDKLSRRAWKSHDWDAMDRLYKKGVHLGPKEQDEVGGGYRGGRQTRGRAIRDAFYDRARRAVEDR
jgi:hypothetical protein